MVYLGDFRRLSDAEHRVADTLVSRILDWLLSHLPVPRPEPVPVPVRVKR